jgi:hypothetical protein
MDSLEFDRRVELVEDALYELKNSGYAQAPDVSAIDAMLACTAELKVELYGMLVGWGKPAEPEWVDIDALKARMNALLKPTLMFRLRSLRFGVTDMILVALIAAFVTAIVAFVFYHY